MSGIAGILSTVQFTPATTLQVMTDALQHRGPDDEGHFLASQVALGYRHFDVYGLTSEQAQTMLYLDRYAVTFDGRIYNLPELQVELSEHGYKFDCASDSALLAAAYDHWGVDCLNKFNADWAFVLYDTKTEIYFIARDRFGIKPLYYYADTKQFVFASEIKSIHASGHVAKAPNTEYLQAYLSKGPNEYDSPTAFKDVVRFPFAHYYHGSLEQLLDAPRFTRYWELKVNTDRESFDPVKAQKLAEQYYSLLADSVRIRMRGSVKIGAALSGGLDSSSIVYLMNQELKNQGVAEPLQTFSSVYKTPGTEHCDESQFINIVANQLGVESHQIEPKPEEVPFIVYKSVEANESLSDGIGVSNFCVAQKAKKYGVKVVLNGQGADEILAGYTTFFPSYLSYLDCDDFFLELNRAVKSLSIKNKVIIPLFWAFNKLTRRNSVPLFSEVCHKKLPKALNLELKEAVDKPLLKLIHYVERIPMSLSVESRLPFLDYRLVEFLFSVSFKFKMRNGWTKYISRLAFDKHLAHEITWREDKMGWPAPLDNWFRGPLEPWLIKQGIINLETKTDVEIVKEVNLSIFENVFFKN